MTKPALSLVEIDRLGELLAAIPEPFVPMEADMLDGYLTAIALMKNPPETADWMAHVFDADGNPRAKLPETRQIELRKLILKRGAQLEEAILSEKAIDPIIYEEDEDEEGSISALSSFSDGFAFACSMWPELMKNENKAVQAALVGILRYESRDTENAGNEQDEEVQGVLENIEEEVPFTNLDEALADLEACVQEIAEVTRAFDIEKAKSQPKPKAKKPGKRR